MMHGQVRGGHDAWATTALTAELVSYLSLSILVDTFPSKPSLEKKKTFDAAITLASNESMHEDAMHGWVHYGCMGTQRSMHAW